MNDALARIVANLVALAIGIGVGVRTFEVAEGYYRLNSISSLSGGGMIIGLGATMLLAFVLLLWRRLAAPQGMAWQCFAALEAGLWIGAVLGWIAFPATRA